MKAVLKLYPLALIGVLWELAARLEWVDPFFLPPVSEAIKAIISSPDFLTDTLVSLARAFAGLLLGGGAGLICGMLMARYRPVDDFMSPLVGALFPTPKLALFPLLMLWFGLGEGSKIAIIAITAFFPVALNTYAGMRGVDKFLIWNALTKGANSRQIMTRVMLPAAMPFIFAGFRVATSFSFLLVVAAEMLNASSGLGYRILYAERTFEPALMYGGILIVAALGFIVDRLIGLWGKRMLAWQDVTS